MIADSGWLAVLAVGLVAFCKLGTVFTILGRGLDGRGLPGPLVAAGIALVGTLFFVQPVSNAADPAAVARQTLEQQSSEKARAVFASLGKGKPAPAPKAPGPAPVPDDKPAPLELRVLAVAALTTQLGSAFQIGFLLLLPFLLLEVLAGVVLTATGASSLRASTVSLPFKLLLFVSVDGWTLLWKGLLGGGP